jgi:serine-type D-Ala-D-Ala carboxypeptidase/endopeptidase (penicillin-binding protein 4)
MTPLILMVTVLGADPVAAGEVASDPACRDLRTLIDGLAGAPAFAGAKLGLYVERVEDRTVLYSRDAETLFVPASNVKLASTATALNFLGPDYRFTTELLGTLDATGFAVGDLFIRGNGDPWLVPERVWYLASRLYYRGVREVRGDIIVDDTYFSGPRLANGSEQDQSSSAYMAPIGAVSVGFNAVMVHVLPGPANGAPARIMLEPQSNYAQVRGEVRTTSRGRTSVQVDVIPEGDRSVILLSGKIAVTDPGRGYWRRIDNPPVFAGEVLRAALQQVGIAVRGKVKVAAVPAGSEMETLVDLASPRLAELITRVNKQSNNFMAEQIARATGAVLYGPPGDWAKAERAIQRFLEERVEIPRNAYTIANASGLHNVNHLTPKQLVRILEYMYAQPSLGPEFVASMAVASSSGTLSERMKDSDAVGLLRAKTGTLSIASALSGYVTARQGETIAFSIVLNDYKTKIDEIWAAQDALGAALAAVDSSCSVASAQARLPVAVTTSQNAPP